MKCYFNCGAETPDTDSAINEGWEPSAWSNRQLREVGPICASCVKEKTQLDEDIGVFNIRREFDRSSEAAKDVASKQLDEFIQSDNDQFIDDAGKEHG